MGEARQGRSDKEREAAMAEQSGGGSGQGTAPPQRTVPTQRTPTQHAAPTERTAPTKLSGGSAPGRTLPSPHPPLPVLVGLHARLLVWEAAPSTAVLAAAALALPLWTFATGPPEPGTPLDGVRSPVLALGAGFVWLALVVALLWPDMVWRKLGPGERGEIDALPASRRTHRLARLIAGAGVPLAMGASAFFNAFILERQGWFDAEGPLALRLVTGAALPGAALGLVAAYLLTSIFALRFGRVLLPLVLVVIGVFVAPLVLAIVFEGWGLEAMGWLWAHPMSPGVTIFLYGGPGRVLGPLFWVLVLGAVATRFAGAHDHA